MSPTVHSQVTRMYVEHLRVVKPRAVDAFDFDDDPILDDQVRSMFAYIVCPLYSTGTADLPLEREASRLSVRCIAPSRTSARAVQAEFSMDLDPAPDDDHDRVSVKRLRARPRYREMHVQSRVRHAQSRVTRAVTDDM